MRTHLKANNEVVVAFKVQPDGSVNDLDIRSSSSRVLDAAVLDAVRQWRYGPVPAAREHSVQLVFNLGP